MDLFAAAAIIVCLMILSYRFISREQRYGNLPPGPRPLPLIGNMLQLVGRDLRDVCRDCRRTYGDLFTLHIFNRIIIVVNGFDSIKDVFVKNGDAFSERYTSEKLKAALKGDGIGIANGEIWKRNRALLIRTLRDLGVGKSLERCKLQSVIHEEISFLLGALEEEQGKPFDVEHSITKAVSNIICCLVFGKRFDYHDEEFTGIVLRIQELFASDIALKPSWFRLIPGDPFRLKRSLQTIDKLAVFYKTKIREHLSDFDSRNIRDVIDGFIKRMGLRETTAEKSQINDIAHSVYDVFAGGTDTISSSLRMALLYLLRDPGIQEELYSELKSTVPDHRLPGIEDLDNMPFLQATVREVLRRASVVPLSLPHAAKSDQVYRGYTIPKAACILPNLESVLFDDTLWDEPLKFNPSRFLNGKTLQEKAPEELIPFGIGRRSCPGEQLAEMELTLFLTAMVQRFRFLPPKGENPPCFASVLGSAALTVPFKLRAIKRM